MTRYISRRYPISIASLKRKPLGTVVFRHVGSWEDVKFTRVKGGWKRERWDFIGLRPEIVSSADVADECNRASGYKESWAKIY